MANINLSDGYFLKSDANGWMIGRKMIYQSGAKTGEEYEQLLGFYPGVGSALGGVLERRMRFSASTTLQELQRELQEFKAEVAERWSTEAVL